MFRDKLRLMLRTLKIIHSLDRATLPLLAAQAVVGAFLPLVPLVVSARVVTGLENGLPARELIVLALAGSALAFTLVCVQQVLDKAIRVHNESTYFKFDAAGGQKALSMDFQELDSESTRRIRDRIQADLNWGGGMFAVFHGFQSIVRSAALCGAAMALAAPMLAVLHEAAGAAAFLAAVAAFTIASILYVNGQQKRSWKALNESSARNRVFWHLITSGIRAAQGKDIRVYGAQPLLRERGGEGMARSVRSVSGRAVAGFGRGGGASAAVSGAIQGGAYLFVALQALSGALDIGSVFLYAGAIHQFSEGLSQLLRMCGEFALSCERMRSSYEFLDIADTLYKGTIPVERRRDNDYVIEFHDVSFRYPGSETWALRNLNMKLRVGERMALVGRNGSGKTTVIKLLCRLYDPTEGAITLNGVDIRKYDYHAYLRLFSVVFQDFQLYAFPLGQNVAASTKVDEARARDALDKAGFAERLHTMGLGCSLYKDFDDTGVEISGGEAQKIALARALYKGAPFVILDEPTAALDPIAEFEIYSRFDGIVGQRTAVYISHRLSSCRFCQDIAVFHEGRLVQRGSHDDLLADSAGQYRELWMAQAQYYQDQKQSA